MSHFKAKFLRKIKLDNLLSTNVHVKTSSPTIYIFFWRKGEGTDDFYFKKNILFFHIHRRHVNRWSADGLKNFWVPSFFYKRLYNTGTPLCNLSLPFHDQVKSFVAVKCCFIIQHHLRHHLLPSASQYLDFNYSLNKKNETKVL